MVRRVRALEDEVEIFRSLAKERDARTQRDIVSRMSWGLKHLLVSERGGWPGL